jgi:hypothetical protein
MRHRGREFENPHENTMPYSVTAYDNVFVLLKKDIEVSQFHKDRLHYDKVKDRHYFSGRIIEWIVTSESGLAITTYPKKHMIALVDHKDWTAYKTVKYDKIKEQKIMNIPHSHIDFITLDFNSFDWQK